jgi:hypothetical protein
MLYCSTILSIRIKESKQYLLPNLFGHNRHDKLMRHGAEGKCDEHRCGAREAVRGARRSVYMA